MSRFSSVRTQGHYQQCGDLLSSGDSRNSDRDISYKTFYKFTVFESWPRTTPKVFEVVLLFFGHEVREVNYKRFAKSKKPPRTSSARTTTRTSSARTTTRTSQARTFDATTI